MKSIRRQIKKSAGVVGGRQQDQYIDTGWLNAVIAERYPSNAECAREMGIGTSVLSRLVNGRGVWAPEYQVAFQKATGRSAEELLGHLTQDGWKRRQKAR